MRSEVVVNLGVQLTQVVEQGVRARGSGDVEAVPAPCLSRLTAKEKLGEMFEGIRVEERLNHLE